METTLRMASVIPLDWNGIHRISHFPGDKSVSFVAVTGKVLFCLQCSEPGLMEAKSGKETIDLILCPWKFDRNQARSPLSLETLNTFQIKEAMYITMSWINPEVQMWLVLGILDTCWFMIGLTWSRYESFLTSTLGIMKSVTGRRGLGSTMLSFVGV